MDEDDIFGLGAAIGKIADLGRDATKLDIIDITPPQEAVGLVPFKIGFNQGDSAVVDLSTQAEKWRIHPARRMGTANVSTLQAFMDLTNRHKTDHSVIFAATSWPNPSLTAVIDYHEKDNGKPQYGQHKVHYPFPLTVEFQAWANQDGKPMKQGEFATFIEERVAELATATGQEDGEFATLFGTKMATPADMLALSRGLEVNVEGRVKQSVKLSSGEGEIVFVEEHMDSNGQKIVVPGLFMVSVPAFLDGVPVRLPARLRYRVAGGSITWSYQLYRWKELLRERVVADLAAAETETDLPAYEGSPER